MAQDEGTVDRRTMLTIASLLAPIAFGGMALTSATGATLL